MIIELQVIGILNPPNLKPMDDLTSVWMIKFGDAFKPNSTRIWRNGSNITEASALLLLIDPYEEPTKNSFGQNITSMLLINCILVFIDSDGAAGNIRNI